MTPPIICTSEFLRTDAQTACVASAIHFALERLGIEHRELKNTNDYWIRDFMPVSILEEGVYSRYIYRPDYLWDYKSKRKYITDQRNACGELNLFAPTNMGIVFDGGNYVRCGDKVIMTDKVFMENANWSAQGLMSKLDEALLTSKIILLPWDMKDPCGHADGMVAYMGEGKLLLNNCWKKKDKAFHKRLLKLLEPHFEVVELSYDCSDNENSWCYLNYLRVPNGILLPCLSDNADCESDIAALNTFSNIFPDSEIIPIYSKPLIDNGGALHCVTWEYYECEDNLIPRFSIYQKEQP